MKKSLKQEKEIIKLGIDFDSELDYDTIINLANSNNPFDRLYGHLQIDRRRVTQIEKQTVAEITKQYKKMVKEIKQEMGEMKEYLLTPGTQPTQSELLEFFQDQRLISLLEERIDQLQGNVSDIITQGIYASSQIGFESWQKDFETLSRLHAITQEEAERMLMFNTPRFVASEVTIPLAVGDTRRLSSYTKNLIIEVLREEALKGSSFQKIISRVGKIEGIPLTRAELISKWSMIKGYNEERLGLFKESNLENIGKMWVARLDDRVCENCLALHGTIKPLSKEFDGERAFANKAIPVYMGLETPPRHPRCRCSIVLWRNEWRDKSIYTPEDLYNQAVDHAKNIGYKVPNELEKYPGIKIGR